MVCAMLQSKPDIPKIKRMYSHFYRIIRLILNNRELLMIEKLFKYVKYSCEALKINVNTLNLMKL